MDAKRVYRVPALFWFDFADRSPVDSEDQMPEQLAVHGNVVSIIANAEQIGYLLSDAEFYAKGNVDDAARLVKSAKATVAAIKRAA